jgi:GDPmannose 4,6-dehydratase
MTTRTALIVGSAGQDGNLMQEILAREGLRCVNINRGNCDIRDYSQVSAVISQSKPHYLFYFAAHHTSATEEQMVEQNRAYFDINTIGVLNCLDAIKLISPDTRFFFTSSSLIFMPSISERLNEQSKLSLCDLYTISKHASMKLCDHYREKFGLHTTVGIMFNHESRYRKSKFVSKKIIEYVAAVNLGTTDKLSLGDLNTVVDWGAAEDYMEAAYLLLKNGKVGHYVFSSGTGHTLRNFCEVAFSYKGLDYTDYVSSHQESMARINHTRIGDNTKLKETLNWWPKTSFDKMIGNMIDNQIVG